MKPEIEEYPSEDCDCGCKCAPCSCCGKDMDDCECNPIDEDDDWSDWQEFTDESVEFFDDSEE